MSTDKSRKVTEITGTITMADGSTTHFTIGEDYGWQQGVGMKAGLEHLGRRVAVLEAIVAGLTDNEGGDFTFASANDTDDEDEGPDEGDEDDFEPEDQGTYKVRRFFQDERKNTQVIETGLTLEQAQAHCQDPSSKGIGWFDGYDKEA